MAKKRIVRRAAEVIVNAIVDIGAVDALILYCIVLYDVF